MAESKNDPTIGEQLDLEKCLNLGYVHKMDRSRHHPSPALDRSANCWGKMQVVASTGTEFVSCCKTCGVCVRTTLTKSTVSKSVRE